MALRDSESGRPLIPNASIPNDSFHIAYIIYFILGAGYLLPWNAFITAVDYFTHLYPGASVDRVFSVVFNLTALLSLVWILAIGQKKTSGVVRMNVGYGLFLVTLLTIPVIDVWYVKGRVEVYGGYYATVGAVGLCGLAVGLVEGGVVGNAGELPERYMQAVFAGTAASGVLVSFLRVLTKAMYPQDASGLRQSANLYFIVAIMVTVLNIIFFNVSHKLPVIKYYNDVRSMAEIEGKEQKGKVTGKLWRSMLWDIVGDVKGYGFGILIIYIVTLSIFPGSITEDVHSKALKDWYPIVLITGFNVFDLIGKSLTSLYLMQNAKFAMAASFGRLLFLPVFYGCLHGPAIVRTEIVVMALTCLLGLTNGYFTSVLMILAPKTVPIQHAEMVGIVLVLYLVAGVTIGSVFSWFWVL